MSQRILLAEASDTIRGVATTVLRQNGFEVISVGTPQKALEVLNHSRPNLLIVGGTLADAGGSPFYERISHDHRFVATPMLLFAEPGQPPLPFPDEVIVNLPFDPKEFIDRVADMAGAAQARPASTAPNPLDGDDLADDAIDAALGLDRIEVTGSEEMDKTKTRQTRTRRRKDKMVGFDHEEDSELTDSSRVESIRITDEAADITPGGSAQKPPAEPSSSGKLDILDASDQYGMNDPSQFASFEGDKAHDYEWFINEMQRDAQVKPPAHADQNSEAAQLDLTVTDNSTFIDPITPPPASPSSMGQSALGDSVEKFIDEFKKEVEKIHESEPESVVVEAEPGGEGASAADRSWEDSLEKISAGQIDWFTKEFVQVLAERIAGKIAAKIDNEKLLALLKAEITAQAARKKQGQT